MRILNETPVAAKTRIALAILLLIYLATVVISHSVPLPSSSELPLGLIGWLAFVAVVSFLRSKAVRSKLVARQLFQPWVATVIFGVFACLTLFMALTGNLSIECPSHATSCVKIDIWRISEGHFYRQFPYDSQGNSDPNPPSVEISRQTYIDEVGTRLRMAAAFGVGALCLAWLVAGSLAKSAEPRSP